MHNLRTLGYNARMQHKYITDFDVPNRVARLERELACFYTAIALLLEECYLPGAGLRALNLKDQADVARLTEDVKSTAIGRMLPVWARYAYEGVVSAGYGDTAMDTHAGGNLENLRGMLHLLRVEDPYFEMCLSAAQTNIQGDFEFGGLQDLSKRVTARHDLDTGSELTAEQLALLANMSERSVRNAMLAGGDLKANANGDVGNAEAKRWLQGRRGFVPTTRRELPTEMTQLPDALDAVEIPPFIERRLAALWRAAGTDAPSLADPRFPEWVMLASRNSGLPPEQVLAGGDLPLSVRPQDCELWAKALRVEPVWFTHQVMSALFPQQVDMLLNPDAWNSGHPEPETAAPATVTVTLTRAMLLHGYIDLPASASAMFPADSLGTRHEGETGAPVAVIYGSHRAETDIRIKSARTISPRKRFGSWLNEELNARPGDRIRVEKTGEREYTLSHVASPTQ